MKEIRLTNSSRVALVDDEDYPAVAVHSWREQNGYAIRLEFRDGKRRSIRMHREIIGASEGVEVDHRDGNKLDNRRKNLRLATKSQNQANARPHRDNKAGLKGVTKLGNRWRATITTSGETFHLGLFPTRELAGEMYDFAARLLHGSFARPNRKNIILLLSPGVGNSSLALYRDLLRNGEEIHRSKYSVRFIPPPSVLRVR